MRHSHYPTLDGVLGGWGGGLSRAVNSAASDSLDRDPCRAMAGKSNRVRTAPIPVPRLRC